MMAFDPDAYLSQTEFDPDAYLGVKKDAPSFGDRFKQEVQASIPGRILQGMRDPVDAAAKLLPKGLEAITSLGGTAPNRVSQFFGSEASRVQDINRENEAAYQAARQATGSQGMDVARFTGNVASPANLAIALRAGLPATVGGKIAQGAGFGAAGGALSDADVNAQDYWTQKAKDVALGGTIGAAVPAVVSGAARVVRPQTSPQVQALMKEGVTPTPGQILGGNFAKAEEKLQSVPLIGEAIGSAKQKATEEFNKAALNRALKPIGQTVSKLGREGVEEVEKKIGAVYDDLLPRMTFKADQQFTQEMAQLNQMAQSLGEKEASKFQTIMRDTLGRVNQNGMMTGETLKTVQSKLSAEARRFGSSPDPYQQELGDALKEAGRILRDSLPRTNPQFADELSKANQAWANYTRIRQAASSTATGAREGIFSPAQLAQAVRMGDKTVGKGASAKGQALMQDLAEQGTQVLGSKVPDSGTAGRIANIGALAAFLMNPKIAIPLAAGSAPYVGPLRQGTAALLTKRPANAQALADLLRRSSPALAGAIPLAIGNNP